VSRGRQRGRKRKPGNRNRARKAAAIAKEGRVDHAVFLAMRANRERYGAIKRAEHLASSVPR
jgi:hypothetical protein